MAAGVLSTTTQAEVIALLFKRIGLIVRLLPGSGVDPLAACAGWPQGGFLYLMKERIR